MNTSQAETDGVRAVQRALQLLSLLGPAGRDATLSELTRQSGLATSTVQRLLQTLEKEHFLKRLPGGRYTLGVGLMQLGVCALHGNALYAPAQAYLEQLSEHSRETANLGIWDAEDRVIYIRQAQSPRSIRHVSWLGRPFSPEQTSMGLALRGELNGDAVAVVRANALEPDVTGVAAPVYDSEQAIVAGINITGPTYRISDEDVLRFGKLVSGAAHELTIRCGGRWLHAGGGVGSAPSGSAADRHD